MSSVMFGYSYNARAILNSAMRPLLSGWQVMKVEKQLKTKYIPLQFLR